MNRYRHLVPVLLASAYFWMYTKTYTQWHFIDYVNLIFHEAGHTIFFFIGEFLAIAAGSFTQIAIPFSIAVYFFIQKKHVSSAICLMWTGQNFLNVSVYAHDATRLQLELLGGDFVIHDWNYLLNAMGLLHKTDLIAQGIFAIGFILIFLSTIWGIHNAWTDDKMKKNDIHR